MTDPTTQAAVERLESLARSTPSETTASAIRMVLSAYATQAERIKELEDAFGRIAALKNSVGLGPARAIAEAALSAAPQAAPSLPANDVSSLIAARCSALPGKLLDCPVCGAVDKERDRQEADVVGLNWLAARPNCELSHGYDDPEDEGSWRVHRVNGGINDREWTLIGSGSTPLYAIQSAMEKDAKPVTMLVDQEWLSKHSATDPDSSVEAGPDVFADRVAGEQANA